MSGGLYAAQSSFPHAGPAGLRPPGPSRALSLFRRIEASWQIGGSRPAPFFGGSPLPDPSSDRMQGPRSLDPAVKIGGSQPTKSVGQDLLISIEIGGSHSTVSQIANFRRNSAYEICRSRYKEKKSICDTVERALLISIEISGSQPTYFVG